MINKTLCCDIEGCEAKVVVARGQDQPVPTGWGSVEIKRATDSAAWARTEIPIMDISPAHLKTLENLGFTLKDPPEK